MRLYAKVIEHYVGFNDNKKIEQYPIGSIVEVDEIIMGQSRTTVVIDDQFFNSVSFEFYEDEDGLIEKDIYNDPRYNPYI